MLRWTITPKIGVTVHDARFAFACREAPLVPLIITRRVMATRSCGTLIVNDTSMEKAASDLSQNAAYDVQP